MIASISGQVAAAPPTTTDHGVNESTFHTLWSGDFDSDVTQPPPTTGSMAWQELAATVDIPFDRPPEVVEHWNRADLEDFPRTDASQSISPLHAELHDGPNLWIRDASVSIFAVQPSTRLLVSPGQEPLFVAPNGEVLGTVDYRIHVPEDRVTPTKRTFWELVEHRIESVRLTADGTTLATTSGTHTPRIEYGELGVGTYDLTLEADITVKLEKTTEVKVCDQNCSWERSTTTPTSTLTVEDSLQVEAYHLTLAGYQATYPNGDVGLVVFKNQAWQALSLPNGERVVGVWRFYTARNPAWDTLVTRTATSETLQNSTLQPLQVFAYPSRPGSFVLPATGSSDILSAWGTAHEPPRIGEEILVDVVPESYNASYGLAVRAPSGNRSLIVGRGIVRGVDVTPFWMPDRTIHPSRIDLSVRNTTDTTVTVRIQVSDAVTGAPVRTANESGYVVVAGHQQVETNATGIAITTIPRPLGPIRARLEPTEWWLTDHPVTASSTSRAVPSEGGFAEAVSFGFRFGSIIAGFLLVLYLFDKLIGGNLWPPWRGAW